MASSNRHWPSMFKSKPCTATGGGAHPHHHHDINSSIISGGCHRPSYSSGSGIEERSPEPKPRWNPRPEQIRILESIFNSGMVNPPREEIRKIRAQLQEYGQVGDANVFYWFQNRKSRSKNKQRHLQTPKQPPRQTPPAAAKPPSSSTSSSSDKSSDKAASLSIGSYNSPTGSVNQPYFHSPGEFLHDPFFSPPSAGAPAGDGGGELAHGFFFSELTSVVQAPDPTAGNCSGMLLGDLMMNVGGGCKKTEEVEKVKLQQQLGYAATTAGSVTAVHPTTAIVPSTINQIQGTSMDLCGSLGPTKSMVFINDVAFEVAVGPFDVREAFGDDVVLVHANAQPVPTNGWGVTIHPLQPGAFYYLVQR